MHSLKYQIVALKALEALKYHMTDLEQYVDDGIEYQSEHLYYNMFYLTLTKILDIKYDYEQDENTHYKEEDVVYISNFALDLVAKYEAELDMKY